MQIKERVVVEQEAQKAEIFGRSRSLNNVSDPAPSSGSKSNRGIPWLNTLHPKLFFSNFFDLTFKDVTISMYQIVLYRYRMYIQYIGMYISTYGTWYGAIYLLEDCMLGKLAKLSQYNTRQWLIKRST